MGAESKNSSLSNSLRVKVYQLTDDGKWDDQGTGRVRIDYLEGCEDLGLIVIDEEDSEAILVHRISPNVIYRRQEDTIVSWRDPQLATELALSFQEATGCSYFWDQICGVQRDCSFDSVDDFESGLCPPQEALEATVALRSNNDSFRAVSSELRDLPSVELSTLPLILKTVHECGIADQMRVAEMILQDQEFFRKLISLFRTCEDLGNMDGLYMIFKLVKGIILLNCPQIFEKIFGEEYILDIIGSLEYNPEVHQVQHHRAFLKEHVVFKEAISIKDPSVLSRIHQTYRISYIKDVILPRALDEATVTSFNIMINTNNAFVISSLKDDTSFIQQIFARMRSSFTLAGSKRDLVFFLHEFCSLSKSLQLGQQLQLFRDLAAEGIFDIIKDMMKSQDRKLVSAGTDILILFLNQDPNLLRSYVIQQDGKSLLGLLVQGMITDFWEDMHCQFVEIIRILLDSYNTSGSQRDAIIEIFYQKHIDQLMDVIAAACPPRHNLPTMPKSFASGVKIKPHGMTKPEILSNICDLLCFCVVHHPYKIKCNFLMNNGIEKILLLTRRREKYLVVAAVRFMRTIISHNDEHLLRHIVKKNLIKPIIEAFIGNGNRCNMLHSGVLELLEYICKGNIKILVAYVVDYFWDQLVKFQHLATIHALKNKYEQMLENYESKNATNIVEYHKRIEQSIPLKEEGCLNGDSDEEDSGAHVSHTQNQNEWATLPNRTKGSYSLLRPGSVGLVDYDDDEDDDDDDDDDGEYNPPAKKSEALTDDDDGVRFQNIKRKASTSDDIKDMKLELTKKQKLDVHVNDGKFSIAEASSGSNSNSPSKSIPSHQSTTCGDVTCGCEL